MNVITSFMCRRYCFLLIVAFYCSLFSARTLADPEPQFPKGAPWFNVTRPLTAADLKGRVVLLDFFTPGCINCIHTLPETSRLEKEFGEQLLVIGVNSPKFKASQGAKAIKGFIRRYGIHHPIITDKSMQLWGQYGVFAWPTFVLIGPNGNIVSHFIGEGHYAEIRKEVIKTLAQARKANTLNTAKTLPLKPMVMPLTPLLQPGKVAINSRYVAVSDSGHNRIVLLNHHGMVIHIIGNGHPGATNGKSTKASFNEPQGLAFDGDMLYVADTGNQLIRGINLQNLHVITIAGNGKQQYGVVGLHRAQHVSLNSPWALRIVGHVLYIAMAGDHQVWKLNLLDHRIGPFAGNGEEGISDGPASQASFAQSSGLAYHHDKLFVADPESSSVRVINLKNMHVHTLVGKGLFIFGMRDGAASQALLQHDQGLAYSNDTLYIADTFNNAIRTLNLATGEVKTLATGLAQPGGLAILSPHHLLVADTNDNRLVTINTINGHVAPWPISGLKPPNR